MKKFNIRLVSIDDVKRFVTAANMQCCDIDIVSGRYVIDAKSIMGLFSLDLSHPITVEVHGTEDDGARFYDSVKELVVS